MDRGNCRGCGTLIYWVVMESGKRNPLNPEPDAERGNILIPDDGSRARSLGLDAAAGARAQGRELYLSHFATCPARAKFRKKDRKR